jgi:hypothetical protein
MIRTVTEQIAAKIGGFVKYLYDVDGPGILNSGLVVREDRPDEGGIYLHIYGYRYTYKGTPNADAVYALHRVKKTLLPLARSFNNTAWKILFGLFYFIPSPIKMKIIEPFVNFAFETMEWNLAEHLLDPKRYCNPVRELYRVFTVMESYERFPQMKKVLHFIRDFFCMMVEYDSAYRFRFQDIMAEIKKEELLDGKKLMAKEIDRMFDILLAREVPEKPHTGKADYDPPMQHKWRFLKGMMGLAIRFIWFVPKIIREFAEITDFEKLKFDDGDKYFVYMRKDYEFFGIPLPERIQMRKKIEDEVGRWDFFEPVANGFLENYNQVKLEALGATKNAIANRI